MIEVDRKTVDGRLVYLWPSDIRKARLDVELNAAELDLDGTRADGRELFLRGPAVGRPVGLARLHLLAQEIGRAHV